MLRNWSLLSPVLWGEYRYYVFLICEYKCACVMVNSVFLFQVCCISGALACSPGMCLFTGYVELSGSFVRLPINVYILLCFVSRRFLASTIGH